MIGNTHRSRTRTRSKAVAIDSLHFFGRGRLTTLFAIILYWFTAASFPELAKANTIPAPLFAKVQDRTTYAQNKISVSW
jgi:hypothetical protein